MQTKIAALQEKLQQAKGARNQIAIELKDAKKTAADLYKEVRRSEKAQVNLQHVANSTQKMLEYHISEMVNLALAATFKNPYTLNVEFELSGKGQTLCNFTYTRNENTIKQIKSGGVRDWTAVALRLSLWALARPKTRPLLVLDEPFKHLSVSYRPRVIEVLKELTGKLGLQLLIVVQDAEAMEGADRLFMVTMKNNKSIVKEMK